MKKYILFISILSLLFRQFCFSQSPALQSIKCFHPATGNWSWSLLPTSDGSFTIGGYVDSDTQACNYGIQDMIIFNSDSSGNVVWQNCLGGSNQDEMYSLLPCNNGYFFSGITYSNDINVNGNHGQMDSWVGKTDSTGNLLWQRCFGGTSTWDIIHKSIPTNSGGYILAGESQSIDGDLLGVNFLGLNAWLIKLDSSGVVEWQLAPGGTNGDGFYSVIQCEDSGYLAIGYTTSNDSIVTGNHGSQDGWVVKINYAGNIIWQKCFGGSADESINSGIQSLNGEFILTGWTYSNDGDVSGHHGNSDLWLLKIDSLGNMLWSNCSGGISWESGRNIIKLNNQTVLVSGSAYADGGDVLGTHGDEDGWILNFDDSGNLIWQKCIGGSQIDIISDLDQLPNRDILFTGNTGSYDDDMDCNQQGIVSIFVGKLSDPTTSITMPPSLTPFQISNVEGSINTFLINFGDDRKSYPLNIYNLLGESVYKCKLNSKRTILNLNFIHSGIYIVSSDAGSKKIIIK